METLALTRTAVNPISPIPPGDVPKKALIKSRECRRVSKKPTPREKNTTAILPIKLYGNSFFQFPRLVGLIVNPRYVPIHSCEIKTRAEGVFGAWKPVRTRAADPIRGPSRKGVGKFILTAAHAAIRTIPVNKSAFPGVWITLLYIAGILVVTAACWLLPANPWITMKGTIKTVDSNRMVCIKVTTVRSVSSISSLRTTICVSPPGTLPIMPVARLIPVRRYVMYPMKRLNRIVDEVANIMAGSCLIICRLVSMVNELPSI